MTSTQGQKHVVNGDAENAHPGYSKNYTESDSDKDHYGGMKYVVSLRILLILTAIWSIRNAAMLDEVVRNFYSWLLGLWVFNSVYFETWFATACYSVIIPAYPWLADKLRCLDGYKIHPTVRYVHLSIPTIAKEALFYMTPLMLLDTFMVKKYDGVSPAIWAEKRSNIIQYTRGLPAQAPTFYAILFQLVASFILYDILFFAVHLTLHKSAFLYKYIHRHHHNHDMVHAHVTNQLTVIERTTLILSANFALKVFYSHPLTRTIFVPLFIGLLVDNHAGYDMPFSCHRLAPFGIVGGAKTHFLHHTNHTRHYQPIFSYLDKALDIYSKKKAD